MKRRKIGVMVECFRLGVKGGIEKAAALGADGFQVWVTEGETAPENFSAMQRREFRKYVADTKLVISALCADFGQGFLDSAKNPELIRKTKACLDLAVDLGTKVVTSHIGTLPADEKDPRWAAGVKAMTELGAHAEKRGVYLASETGPESGEHLKRFLEQIPNRGIKVNYDPANLCMGGFDQIGGVEALTGYIVHTHAKDGVRGQYKEVPLGEGNVDFPRYLAALDRIGYDGFLTIEREVGENPVGDIEKAVKFLRGL